jgi:gamma-glutamyl hercynylcysteine S-oxide synthase
VALDRPALVAWYQRNRARSRALFDLLAGDAYYSRPIALRHPIVFYEGHLPGFSFNTLLKKGLGRPSIDARLEALFARGIDHRRKVRRVE